jgi:hypothetical protein
MESPTLFPRQYVPLPGTHDTAAASASASAVPTPAVTIAPAASAALNAAPPANRFTVDDRWRRPSWVIDPEFSIF